MYGSGEEKEEEEEEEKEWPDVSLDLEATSWNGGCLDLDIRVYRQMHKTGQMSCRKLREYATRC